MSLGLAAPAALAVGLLLAGPVLAHLARRHPRELQAFGAMMLIARLQRRLQRRRLLNDRLLLVARLLALALLILAAALPELRRTEAPSSFGGTGRVVVILDNSLSMDQRDAGDPVFGLARREAAEAVRALPDGVRVAVLTCGGEAAELTAGFTEDTGLAASLLEGVAQSWGATDLRGALLRSRSLLEGAAGEIVVFTDESGPGVIEAAGSDLERLLALGSSVIPKVYAAPVRRNIAPVEAEYGDGIEGGSVRVRLVNYGPDAREVATTVYLPDGEQMTAFVEVPGTKGDEVGEAEERFTVPRQAAGGVARVEIDDPDLPLDNTRWFHLPRVGASRVLVVDGDPGSSPFTSEVYFLERALAPWGAGGPAVDVVAPSGISTLDPARHRVAWLANVADPGPMAAALVEFVRGGGGVVIGMGDNVTGERYNAPLASILPAPLRRPHDLVDLDANQGTPLRAPDIRGIELFRVFSRAESFQRIRARRVMTLEPFAESEEVRTLLAFEGGIPALIERRIGNGRVLVWASTFDLGWSSLPLQSMYMPLVQRITAYMGGDVGTAASTTAAVVGDGTEVSLPRAAVDPEVAGPDGGIVPSTRGIDTLSFVPWTPGAWSVATAGRPPLAWIAVNTAPAESDVRGSTTLVETQYRIAPERMTVRTPLALPVTGLAVGALLLAGVMGRGRSEDV